LFRLNPDREKSMKNFAIAALAAVCGLGLANLPAEAQQRPMGPSAPMAQPPMAQKPMAQQPMAQKAMRKAPRETVKSLQAALNRNGAALRVDGMMGPATRAALKKYQSANGLPQSGRDDPATRAKLGI
jgi:hypothetical protein